VHRVGVHPALQRRGVGRALMAELEDRARRAEIAFFHLDTSIDQVAAQTLYLADVQAWLDDAPTIRKNAVLAYDFVFTASREFFDAGDERARDKRAGRARGTSARDERAGFDGIWISDHFQPWQPNEGHPGQAWVTLSAITQRSSRIRLGTGVTTPTFKYRPAIVAEAFASLSLLALGRIFLGLGAWAQARSSTRRRPAAAEPVMGKLDGAPAAVVRGYRYKPGEGLPTSSSVPPRPTCSTDDRRV